MSVRIKYLNIIAFGQFENLTLDFSDGFNLIYGVNESGKSTIAAFIEGLLYGFDEGKKVKRFNYKQKNYMPQTSYKYGGFGIFEKDGISYRVSRDFFTGKYEIYDLDGRISLDVVESNYNYPGEFLLGIDYLLYQNLLANYQSQESTAEARRKIREFFISGGDYNFSAAEAIAFLDEKLAKIGTDRAYTKDYALTKKEITDLIADIKDLQVLRQTYYQDYKKLESLRLEIHKKKIDLTQLRETRDAYRRSKASKNYSDLRVYHENLAIVNRNLAKMGNIKPRPIYDDSPDKKSIKNLALIATALVLLVLAVSLEKYYYIPLLTLVGLIFYYGLGQNKKILPEKDKRQYNDRDYEKYLALVNEKNKLEEIIGILEDQEITETVVETSPDESIDIGRLDEKIQRLESDLEILSQKQLGLEKNFAAKEDKLSREVFLIDRLEDAQARLDLMEEEIAAINLAKEVISDNASGSPSSARAFEEPISEIIRDISKERYQKVIYDDDLVPKLVRQDGQMIGLDQLSTGFIDQLAFALKYTVNGRLDGFMIFDDAFINYDKTRLRASLFYLLDVAATRQILYFTCHDREEEILEAEGIDFNLIHLEEL